VEVEGIVGIEEMFYRGTGSEKWNKEYENPRLHFDSSEYRNFIHAFIV
jgi:hypothetical protein